MRIRHALTLLAASTVGLLSACSDDEADRIVVLAASSTAEALERLELLAVSQEPNLEVELVLAGSQTLVAQLDSGVDADLIITADEPTMVRAMETGRVLDLPRAVATNHLVLAVAPGNTAGVTRLADLGRDELVIGLCAADVPCGALASQVFEAVGIEPAADTEELSVRALATKIQLEEVDAGLVYHSDARALALETIDPTQLQDWTNLYLAALVGDDPSPAATAFLELVIGPAGQSVFQDLGFGSP